MLLQLNLNKPFCTAPYTPAKTSNVQPSTFTINTIQPNPQNHPTTSRLLSRPPLALIPITPPSYNLSSTNSNNIQHALTMSHTQSNSLQMNSVYTSQIPQIPSTTIRTNPHIYTTNTCSTLYTQNTHNLSSSSCVNVHTMPSSKVPITPLDEETIKLTSFCSGDKQFALIRGFKGLKSLPNFFTKQMFSFINTPIDQGFALVYIEDILILSNSKEHS